MDLATAPLFLVLQRFAEPGTVRRGSEPGSCSVRVVAYPADFEYLWSVGRFEGNGFSETGLAAEGVTDLIIVWTDLPANAGMVNTARHLAPLDWAVALASRVAAECADCPAPRLRVWVLDRTEGLPADVWAVALRGLLPVDRVPGLAWVRVVRPPESMAAVLAGVLGVPVAAGVPPTLADAVADAAERARFEQLRWLWICGLTAAAPSDRHALSNLLGPLLLLGAHGRAPAEQAVFRLACDLGLASPIAPEAWVNWRSEPWAALRMRLAAFGSDPVRVLLLDDGAFQLRWVEVLAQALGTPLGNQRPSGRLARIGWTNEFGVELYATDSAEKFLEHFPFLESEETPPPRDWRFVAALAVPGSPAQSLAFDVLFLDLRLHQGQPRKREGDAFAAADVLAKRTDATSPGWPLITDRELASVANWIALADDPVPGIDDNHDGYETGLSLLGRAIARVDLALPVVLFTSARRREVMNRFRGYGTILGGWEKPGLATLGSQDDTHARFAEVFARALELAVARRGVRHLLADPPELPVAQPHAETEWVVEVLLDETGSPPEIQAPAGGAARTRLAVGGLVVIYPASGAAAMEAAADGVYTAMAREKLVLPARSRREPKMVIRDAAAVLLRDLDATAARLGGAVVPFWLATDSWGAPTGTDPLANLQHMDNLHREMTRTAIELGVFWVAPRFIPNGARVTADVRAATRRRRLKECPEVVAGQITEPNLKKRLEAEWGETVLPWEKTDPTHAGEWYVRVIAPDTARAIVEDIRRDYRGTRFDPAVRICRAFALNPRRKASHDAPTATHLLADAAVDSKTQAAVRDADPTNPICRYAWQGDYGDELRRLIAAGRLARRGLVPEALAAFAALNTMPFRSATGPKGEFRNLLLGEIPPLATALTGPEFLRYADLLANMAIAARGA